MTLRARKDSNTFQSVVRVPKDLADLIGKTQIQRGLGTADRREATRLDKIFEGECQVLFARKRAELRGEATLTPERVRDIARQVISEYRKREFGDPLDDDGPSGSISDLQDEYVSLHHYGPAAASSVATRYPDLNVVDVESVKTMVDIEYRAELVREINSMGTPAYIAPAPPEPKASSPCDPPPSSDSTYNLGSKGPLTLEKACELLKGSRWWNGLPEKTRLNYGPTFTLLSRLFGKDRLVHTISPEDSDWLWRMIDALPMHMPKTGDAKEHIEKAIQARKSNPDKVPEEIAGSSKNKHRTVVKHLFDHLTANWYLKTDVTANFRSWSKTEKKFNRVQFTQGHAVLPWWLEPARPSAGDCSLQ
jgi:hypothetical protein